MSIPFHYYTICTLASSIFTCRVIAVTDKFFRANLHGPLDMAGHHDITKQWLADCLLTASFVPETAGPAWYTSAKLAFDNEQTRAIV